MFCVWQVQTANLESEALFKGRQPAGIICVDFFYGIFTWECSAKIVIGLLGGHLRQLYVSKYFP